MKNKRLIEYHKKAKTYKGAEVQAMPSVTATAKAVPKEKKKMTRVDVLEAYKAKK